MIVGLVQITLKKLFKDKFINMFYEKLNITFFYNYVFLPSYTN